MGRFLNDRFTELEPYVPGEQPQNKKYIKLNTNESPYPPSPRTLEAIFGSGNEFQKLRLYPDPKLKELCGVIADYYGVDIDQVIVGNGSDEILAFAFLAFGDREKPMRFPAISYGFYPVFAQLFGLPVQPMALTADFQVDLEDYVDCGCNVVIANPNSPTGICLRKEEIERILASNPNNLVIIDEAYIDFGGESAIPLLAQYDNLIVIQTFSKSRSLAGGRIGFAVASKALVEDMNRIKFSFNPYNVNRLSMLAAVAAMRDREYFEACRTATIKTRGKTVEAMTHMGFTVLPSQANFVFAKTDQIRGKSYFERLKDRGILVRHWDKPEITDFVRITIGTVEEMKVFYKETKEILDEKY